jgi:hypothetical protein
MDARNKGNIEMAAIWFTVLAIYGVGSILGKVRVSETWKFPHG